MKLGIHFIAAGIGMIMTGCASQRLEHDVIPQGYETVIAQSQQDALAWYPRKWGEQPKNIPHYYYIAEEQPLRGAAWISGKEIHFWVHSGNIRGCAESEYRHGLNSANYRGGQAGSQEAEENVR